MSNDPTPLLKPRLSLRKKWAFRLVLIFVLPLCLLALLELALRVAGYGYPTSFLVPAPASPGMLKENPVFGWRFFPKSMARAPLPLLIAPSKSPNTVRIVVFGESAAKGEPEPAYSFARVMAVLLEDQFPDQKFEIINAAITAINSHAILPIAQDCASLRADYWVVYMGNNEVMGPFGPSTVFGARSSSLLLLRGSLALKSLRVGQGLSDLSSRLSASTDAPSWDGLEMFLKNTLPPSDPRLESVYHSFERNLDDILRVGRRASVETLLCTVGVNLRESAPFVSLHRPGFPADQEKSFAQQLQTAQSMVAQRDFTHAIPLLQQLAALDDSYAEVFFQLGRAFLAAGRGSDALQPFQKACDLDGLRFRADSRENQIIRSAASRWTAGVHLVDVARTLAEAAPEGIPGNESFFEYVHFNFEGNYRVARLLAKEVADSLSRKMKPSAGRPWLEQEACAVRLGMTDWHRLEITRGIRSRLSHPPFLQQSTWQARNEELKQEITRLQGVTQTAAITEQSKACRAAMEKSPDDWVQLDQYARFMAAFRQVNEASNAWTKVVQKVPHHFLAWYQLGVTLNQNRAPQEAERCLRQAIHLRPEVPEAHQELGVALGAQKRLPEAEQSFNQALKLRPNSAELQVDWGTTLATQGILPAAISHFRKAVEQGPRNSSARVSFARLLLRQGEFPEALVQMKELVQQQPESLPMRFMLVDALYGTHDTNAALSELQSLVLKQPKSAEAHNRLAVEFANRGRWPEAEGEFAEIVQLRPQDSAARFNLGKSFFDQSRFNDAAEQFKEALRLSPSNRVAAEYLKRIQDKPSQTR